MRQCAWAREVKQYSRYLKISRHLVYSEAKMSRSHFDAALDALVKGYFVTKELIRTDG